MSRLATARDRLEKAVTRLEAVLDDLGDSDAVGDAALKAELGALKRDYAALAATAAEVDGRLQSTIGRLEIVLEN